MSEKRVDAGDAVTEEGKKGVGFFVIESGNARVTVGGEEKRTLGPGDYFGEIALIADLPAHGHGHGGHAAQVLGPRSVGLPARRRGERLGRLEAARLGREDRRRAVSA